MFKCFALDQPRDGKLVALYTHVCVRGAPPATNAAQGKGRFRPAPAPDVEPYMKFGSEGAKYKDGSATSNNHSIFCALLFDSIVQHLTAALDA